MSEQRPDATPAGDDPGGDSVAWPAPDNTLSGLGVWPDAVHPGTWVRRRRVELVVGVLAVFVLVAAVVAAAVVSHDDPAGGGGGRVAASAAVGGSPSIMVSAASVPSPAGSVYTAVARPCDAVELTALENRFGRRIRDVLQRRTRIRSTISMFCAVGLGDGVGIAITQVEILGTGVDGAVMFDGSRRVHEAQARVSDVAGVGARAYTYVLPDVGTHVVVADGNLYMTTMWSMAGGGTPGSEQDVVAALAQVCRQTMANLRT